MNPFRHILVPIDFGDATGSAVDLALAMARSSDARITLVHAFDVTPLVSASPFMPPIDTEPVLASLEREMAKLREALKVEWSKVDSIVTSGNVYDVILEAAKAQGCDLIVIGTHGRRGVSHALLGSVAEKIVRLAPIPVLTVRPMGPKLAKPATAA